MFTGIVEETGRVLAFEPRPQAWRLSVSARTARQDLALGDSIAVDGCCLTAAATSDDAIHFDVLEETRRLTHFSQLRPGSSVNLERSLRFGGKMGGHFVTGHIDAVGTIGCLEARGKDHYLRVRLAPGQSRHVVLKGSVAIDGISLTVAEVDDASFAVWIIPHTLAVTSLREKRVGDLVNLEFDLLGKHVERLLAARLS